MQSVGIYNKHEEEYGRCVLMYWNQHEPEASHMVEPESLTPHLRSLKQDLCRILLRQHESLHWLRWLPMSLSKAVSKPFLSSKLPESLSTVQLILVLNRSYPLTLISNVKLVSSKLKWVPPWYLIRLLSFYRKFVSVFNIFMIVSWIKSIVHLISIGVWKFRYS